MKKYLSIPTTNNGDAVIGIGEGLVCLTPAIGSGFVLLFSYNLTLGLSVVGDEQEIVYSIQNALVNAAQTPHTQVVSTVSLPNRAEVIELVFDAPI
ncbi:MAG: hypothetical protein GY920_11370 [Aliivibrio sp.]|nr:hypothetical protein [Aliivibrio sp.]